MAGPVHVWSASEDAEWGSLHGMQEGGGPLTGVVVDSGHGCTHVIPVVDGYAISSAIRTMPLAVRPHCMAQAHAADMLACPVAAELQRGWIKCVPWLP
jgi:hypothetical protein